MADSTHFKRTHFKAPRPAPSLLETVVLAASRARRAIRTPSSTPSSIGETNHPADKRRSDERSYHTGTAQLLSFLLAASELIADRGYDSNRFRAARIKPGMLPRVPQCYRAARSNSPTTRRYAPSATASRTPSVVSWVGAASLPTTTAARTSSSQQSGLPLSPSSSDNKSEPGSLGNVDGVLT